MSVGRSIHMLTGISLPIPAPTTHIQSFSRIKSHRSDQRGRWCVDDRNEYSYDTVYTAIGQVHLQRSQSHYLYCLHIPDCCDLQRKLCAFVLLSEDQGDFHPSSCPPDLWVMVRVGDIKLLEDSHQECLYLNDTTQKPIFSFPGE